MRTLVIEGWRSIPHSYAIVNAFQCLQLLQKPNLSLRHVDVPFCDPTWKPVTGLFTPAEEAAIARIPAPIPGEVPDATFRIAFPYNISPSIGRRTVVFGTAEFRCVPSDYITANRSLAAACNECDALIVTPSNWSREGFIHSGAPMERVTVIPHGVETSLFHPALPSERSAKRASLGWEGFVFLSLGAMSANKGIRPLLKAFAIVAQKHPQVRLVLKGVASIFSSREMLQQQSARLTQMELSMIQPRLQYLDHTLSFAEVAGLYQSADAYVSPYDAEGFNMPVLEAVASGLPVICTRGGPTDDFTNDDFALRVNAVRASQQYRPGVEGFTLRIDFSHLVHQMMAAVESSDFAAKARTMGPAFVARTYTWPQVTRRLLRVLFDKNDSGPMSDE